MKIAIFDYGSGNIFNLQKSLEEINVEVDVITQFNNIKKYDGLFFPGVGNFDPAIEKINNNSENELQNILNDLPIFGICLGMEILFDSSEEGNLEGLHMISGNVIQLSNTIVPHMGWNNILIENDNDDNLLEGVDNKSWVYFAHSYKIDPQNKQTVIAHSNYENEIIPSIIKQNNLFGTQFHPEKSGVVGTKILQNFLKECKK